MSSDKDSRLASAMASTTISSDKDFTMISSDEDIYKPCPRPDPAKFAMNSRRTREEQLFANFKGSRTEKVLPEGYHFDVRRYRLDPNYIKPPRIFCGFGVNIQDFLDYHQQHNLPRPPPMTKRADIWVHIMHAVVHDLSAHCRFLLKLTTAMSAEYGYVISLYNSHTISTTELEDDEEEDVIWVMKERLQDKQEPWWFFPLVEIF
ncbi:hypothetical protein BT96DRAFT_984187 [Gymnopus androsaceus JB14]|uniref:Uncharacterized protein n=1 Tax=Gymnopus androsaceus JB14 TaxID=1447944 RepID=A0A6A4IIP1_9AGAR|nr:hypothetical protein BT96DRAFT_984187 [Gymnopus androsaceus JB14]